VHRITYADAAQSLQLTYEQVRRRVFSGELEAAEAIGGKQTVTFRSVAALAARMQRDLPLPDVDLSTFAELNEPMRRFHLLGIERVVFLRQLEGDALEAENRGDLATAAIYWQLLAGLREASYAWNAKRQTWAVNVPGVTDAEAFTSADVAPIAPTENAADR
jgi:hypothetical protein